jgi:hypothetical protein
MLTAAQARKVLGVTSADLASLAAAGLLRPHGSGPRRYPVSQIGALLNSPGGAPGTAGDPRPGFLYALGQIVPAYAGLRVRCQLRQEGPHPHLLIRMTGGRQLAVWLVPTRAGRRFLWNRWRSHTAADLPGAAQMIAADLRAAPACRGGET